jgi:hypothetical protein
MWDLPPLSTVVNTAYRKKKKKGYKILSRGPSDDGRATQNPLSHKTIFNCTLLAFRPLTPE